MKEYYLQEVSKGLEQLAPIINKYNEAIQVFQKAKEELDTKRHEFTVIQDQFNDVESILNEVRSSMQDPLSNVFINGSYLTQEDVDTNNLIKAIRDFAEKVNSEQVVTIENLSKPVEEIHKAIEEEPKKVIEN
ncbi:MAG TPA: hypothetical protein VNX68_09865 [Nitrosopumilaceae archaeon]|jgi:hypothetical protein|nr:hypothetical protein [Nitrosopumilaceae archaeon]